MRFSSLMFLLSILPAAFAWGGTVSQVKGQKLIIQMESGEFTQGSEIFIVTSAGKKIGLVTIKMVKGNKALGEITKGRANPGDSTLLRGTGGSNAQAPTPAASTPSNSSSKASGKKGK